jgi:hypothetical protein
MSNDIHSFSKRTPALAPGIRGRRPASSARRAGPWTTALAAAALALSGPACSGIDAGVEYPEDLPDTVDQHLLTPENEASPSITLGQFKIKPDVCNGVETRPITETLSPEDLSRFMSTLGSSIQPKKARGNLYWFDFPTKDKEDGTKAFVRLRLAVLESTEGATQDLHSSLLLHGPGWWGVRRSNLAVLAPKADLDEALAFAIKYKLVCWGVFTYAGNDDAYVVPGPYAQL